MKRPQDPRNHGLKEPKKVFTKTASIYIDELDFDGKVPLHVVVAAWNKALKEIESQGFRVSEAPAFNRGSYYGRSISLSYSYEWDNQNYEVEKQAYDAEMSKYLEGLAKFNEWDKQIKEEAPILALDAKIERAEHRLANLKAMKNKEPLPYPEG